MDDDWVVDINEFRKITYEKLLYKKYNKNDMEIKLESIQEDIVLTEPLPESKDDIKDTKLNLLELLTPQLGISESNLYTSKITSFLQDNVGMTENKTRITKCLMEIFKDLQRKGTEKKSIVQGVLEVVLKTNLDSNKLQSWVKNESSEIIDELFKLAPKLFTISTATKVFKCLSCC